MRLLLVVLRSFLCGMTSDRRPQALRRRALGVLCCAAVACAFDAPAMASSETHSLESQGVREVLAHEVQAPGPSVVSQGGSGGSGDATPPAGELVPSLSTQFSDTWSAPEKPLVTRIYDTPVNYRTAKGNWQTIDDALIASPLGGYENTANSFSLRLPQSLASGVALSYSGQSISFALEGASASLPSVSGDTATYDDVLPSTDLAYVSESAGVREVATLTDASAPTHLRYSLTLPTAITPHQQVDGSIALQDAEDQTVFTIPAPVAFRPAAGPSSGRPLPMAIAASGSAWTITVDASAGWLREELASGSVAIDPTVSVSATQACTINAETPKTGACASTTMQVGYDATHQEHHALLEFGLSSIPQAAVILNAKLGLYVEAHSTSTAKPVGVYRVTKPWTTSATWETYDGTHAWTTPGGDYNNPAEKSDASVNPSVGTATGWYYWYPTKMVQEWANTNKAPVEGDANEGLIVKDEKDATTQNLLTVASPTAATNKPFLEVSYQLRGTGAEPQYTQLTTPLSDTSTLSVNVASGNLMLEDGQLQTAGVAGFGFSDSRVWNGLNGEKFSFGHWKDTASYGLEVGGDGSLSYKDPGGAWFEFQKQANGGFITPPGIKASACTSGSPEPCPKTLPSGISYEVIYDQSQEHIDFSPLGNLLKREDRFKNTISRESPTEHHVVFTDTQGRKIEHIEEGPEHYVSEIKDISGSRNIKFTYETFSEGEPELAKATDADGKTTSYGYSNYTITKITDPLGNVIKLVYDSSRRITEIIRTNNAEHTTGPTTKFKYYAVGEAPSPCTSTQKATVVTDPDGSEGQPGHTTTYCANVLDEVEQSADAEGNITATTFDTLANETAVTEPSRGPHSIVYDKFGRNRECDIEGTSGEAKTECPTEAIEQGYSSRYAYEDKSFSFQPTHSTSQRQFTTNVCYWGGEHACTGEEASGATGENGALRRATDPLTEHNSANYSYNKNGTVSFATDPDGHKTSYEYDASGNLKTITPPAGSGQGKTTITVDADGRTHTMTQCLAESGGTCTSSETGTFTYNGLDRITEAVYTGPGATKTLKLTYDADGNLEQRVDPSGTTHYKYDPLNRLAEETLPTEATNVYGYDAGSNLSTFTDSGGTSAYFYNKVNELEAMYEPGGSCSGTISKCTQFTYNAAGTLAKITYPSKATLNFMRESLTGRPTEIAVKGPGGATLMTNSYSYLAGKDDTPLIKRDRFEESGIVTANTNYGYDELDRLTGAETETTPETYAPSCYLYTYDGAGNRTSLDLTEEAGRCTTSGIFYKYNAGNELECRQEVSKESEPCTKSPTTEISGYSYDGAGNETAITGYKDPASTAFSYNNLNQLKGLTPPSSSEMSLGYLGKGQTDLTTLGATTLQNSVLGTTKQINESGTSYYARTPAGLEIDERLPGGTTYNPVYDAQGDVIGLLNTAGELVQTIRYGPYGENTKASGSLGYTPTNDPFLFQGGYHLAGGNAGTGNVPNGQYHFAERYYDPTVGRWTQQDPAGASANQYAFVDDPVNEGDPSGEMGAAGLGYWWGQRQWKWCTAHPNQYYKVQSVYKSCQAAYKLGHPGGPEIPWSAILHSVAGLVSVKGDAICSGTLARCSDPVLGPLFLGADAVSCLRDDECEHLGQDISEVKI